MSEITTIVDAYHGDPRHTQLFALAHQTPEVLGILKSASFDEGVLDSLPNAAFAWEDQRRFPVHTKEDTLASVLYRSKVAGYVPPDVDRALADACAAWQLVGVLQGLATAGSEKTASEAVEPTYAVPSLRRLPIDTADQVKLAAEVLERDKDQLDLDTMLDSFVRVAKAASEQGVPLTEKVASYAGLRSCGVGPLLEQVGLRAARTKHAGAQAAFGQLETALAQLPAMIYDRTVLVKMASSLYELDQIGGLDGKYARGLLHPLEAVFNGGISKVAMGGAGACDVAGMQVPVETLMQLPAGIWDQIDVPELGELAQGGDAAQFKQVFDTLPMDLKLILARQLGG